MRRTIDACAALMVWWIAATSHAQEGSTYEASRFDLALRSNQLERELAPSGKRIAFVRVIREEVFVDGELLAPIVLPREAPTWPNTFHWLTEESVIRAELLVREGDVYDRTRIEESMRNLRGLGIFALVRIEAVRGPTPGEVGLLVFTRDLWSLRLETGFSGVGDAFALTAQLTERNLFGRDKQLALRWDRDPKAWSLGEVYYDRRVANHALALTQSFDVIFNQESGEAEGSQGSLYFGRPFYDLGQRISFGLTASYAVFVARRLRGTEIIAVRPTADGLRPCDPGEPRCYLQTWDEQQVGTTASVSYRIGQRTKQTFGFELGFSNRDVEPNEETLVLSGSRAEVEDDVLPRVRRQVFPKLSYSMSLPRYAAFENLSTFGQTESVRVGPELGATMSMPLSAFGSSSDSVVFSAGTGYVWSEHDALAEASVSSSTRLEDGRARDQHTSLLLRGATPPLVFGRFVAVASYTGRRRDSGRSVVSLGGDNGLRGYDAAAIYVFGGSKVYANFEYRSLPLVVQSVHLGGVLFYDVGGVYDSIDTLGVKHSIGAGLRLLFPQFNRYPFRVDMGFPLGDGGFALGLSYGSDQAVSLTATDDAQANGDIR